jgi:hypothetical protein
MVILRPVLGPGLAAGMRLRSFCLFCPQGPVLATHPLRPAGLCPACRHGGSSRLVLVVRLRVAEALYPLYPVHACRSANLYTYIHLYL